jgi:hypothetical protein
LKPHREASRRVNEDTGMDGRQHHKQHMKHITREGTKVGGKHFIAIYKTSLLVSHARRNTQRQREGQTQVGHPANISNNTERGLTYLALTPTYTQEESQQVPKQEDVSEKRTRSNPNPHSNAGGPTGQPRISLGAQSAPTFGHLRATHGRQSIKAH